MTVSDSYKGSGSSDVYFHQLAETSPIGITKVDKDGKIVYANRRAEEILGLKKDEITDRAYDDPAWKITGYDGSDYPTEKDLERMKEYHYGRRKRSNAPDQYEFTFIDKEGNKKDILFAADIIEGTEKSVASLLDITRRKSAEKKIRENEKRF